MQLWYVRMRQGPGGWNFTKKIWDAGYVGIMFGAWAVEELLEETGLLDTSKLNVAWFQGLSQYPTPWFSQYHLGQVRTFLLEVRVGDGVIVYFDEALHVGTVQSGFLTYPGNFGDERIKCRPVGLCRSFGLRDLPSSFRLLRLTGQQTIQKIKSYSKQAALLFQQLDAARVRKQLETVGNEVLLAMLSPQQWEKLCEEYLRDRLGYRSLLL